jgi:hypothetical protein
MVAKTDVSPVADVLILGDELESIVCAIACAVLGLTVVLLRRSQHPWLGGLSTRGGLSYMDLTPEFCSPVFAKLIEEAGVQRVALHPERLHQVLQHYLTEFESRITVQSGILARPIHTETADSGRPQLQGIEDINTGAEFYAPYVLDTTPDASLIRQLPTIPHRLGLGGIFGESVALNTLGVSPVFRIRHLSVDALVALEASCRALPNMLALLEQHMPWLSPEQRQTLLKRPSFVGVDYIDILNPIIGVAYHAWRYPSDEVAYQEAPYWIDGGNVSILSDGTLGFNGLVGRLESIEAQCASSEAELPLPEGFRHELQQVEVFLREKTQNPLVTVLPPETLYIRQTAMVKTQQPLTAQQMYRGGCSLEQAVGSFSYWLDFRGIHAWQAYPNLHPLPKPVFRVGLQAHVFDAAQGYSTVGVLGRSSGYSPLSQGTCRIVQYNALVAEAMAATFATKPQALHQLDMPAVQVQLNRLATWATKPLSPIVEDASLPAIPAAFLEHPLLVNDAALARFE